MNQSPNNNNNNTNHHHQQQACSPTTSMANRIYLDVLKREFNITKGLDQFTTQQLTELIRVLRLNAGSSTSNLMNNASPPTTTTTTTPTKQSSTTQNFGMMNPPLSSPSKTNTTTTTATTTPPSHHQPHFYQPQQAVGASPSKSPSNNNSINPTPQKSSPMKRPHSSLTNTTKVEVISLDNSPIASMNAVTDDVIFVKEEVKTEITTTPTKKRSTTRQTASTPMSSSGMISTLSSPMSTTSTQSGGFTTPTKERRNILGPYLDGSFNNEQTQPIHTPLNSNANLAFSKNASSHIPTPSYNDLSGIHLDQYSQLLFSPSSSVPLSQLNINSPLSSSAHSITTPSSSQTLGISSQLSSPPQPLLTSPPQPELKITDAATPKAHAEKKKKSSSSRKKKGASSDSSLPPTTTTTIPSDSPLALMTSPPAIGEKRKKKFVSSCSEKLLDRIQRALTQRLFLIGKKDKKEHEETFAVLGTTGNVYDVHVCQVPTCSCPDFKRGNFCKHILFVYLRVLRIPATHYVIYQKALMKAELEAIFSHAPTVLSQSLKASDQVIEQYNHLMSQDTSQLIIGQQRKTLVGSHCPICYEDFIIGKEKTDHCLVCGTNVHEECLKAWKNFDPNFPCPTCRTSQFGKGQSSVLATSEGYCNLSQYQPNTPKCR